MAKYLIDAACLFWLTLALIIPACRQSDKNSPLLSPEKRQTSGRYKIELLVKAEEHGSGIWVARSSIFKTGMISYYTLGLPPELSKRFEEWTELYRNRLLSVDFDYDHFNDVGRRLTADLKNYLGSECHVEYKPIDRY